LSMMTLQFESLELVVENENTTVYPGVLGLG
jgi:hypothetical protein